MTTRKQKSVLAWHFSAADCRLGNGDGRLIVAGETLTVDCAPVLCQFGLHASVRLIDALQYAPGPYIWRVRIGGQIVRGNDKLCGTSRESLWGFDATDLLRKFARQCALDVAHLWDMPLIVREYLETGDESKRFAAWAAAWEAARDAARDAAGAAAWEAALAAAWAAAWEAALAAAWAAAWEAALAAQNKRLTAMVNAYHNQQVTP